MTGENNEHKAESGTRSLTHLATGPRLPMLAHLPARPPTRLPAHARLPACWPPANARSSAHALPPARSRSQSAHPFAHPLTCPCLPTHSLTSPCSLAGPLAHLPMLAHLPTLAHLPVPGSSLPAHSPACSPA